MSNVRLFYYPNSLLRSCSVNQIQRASLRFTSADLLKDRTGHQNFSSTTTMPSARDGQSDLAPTEKAVMHLFRLKVLYSKMREYSPMMDSHPAIMGGRHGQALSLCQRSPWLLGASSASSSSIVRILTTSFYRRLWRYSRCFPRVLLQNASFRRKSVGRIHRPSGSRE